MQSLFNFFFQSLKDNPQCNALFVDNQAYTYEAVHTRILRFAKLIHQTGSKVEFIGLFAHKSIDAYAGLLSILKSGKAYLPLNPKFSEERNLSIIDLSGIDTLIVGKEELTKASVLLKSINKHINVIIDLERDQVPQELLNLPYLSFYFLSNGGLQNINAIYQSQWAYLLFTSGSTGVPKGVPISHDNVISYVNYLSDRYKPTVDDRFSQTFDLTFDLSVHDMFLCWANGATLYPIPDKSVMAPANFINKNKITFWFSVPSVAVFMSRFRMLKESAFLSLRYSLFCGEPLPLTLAEKWQKSAPNSIIENIYGPTEATIGISHYRWVKDIKNKSFNGIVSIGKIFSSQEYIIIDDNNKEVATGDLGELCLRGNQVFNGYLNDLEKTKEVFISLEGKPEQWYRTGDIVFTDE
jgi:non-ribosomal peptide synthetase component F